MDGVADVLKRQFAIASRLLHCHLDTITTAECLWRPTDHGPHVLRGADGGWRADWPDREDDALGPASIAWLTWHVGFWWTTVLDHSFGDDATAREDILWPGDADGVRRWIGGVEHRWRARIDPLSDEALVASTLTRWPFTDRPFADVVAWVAVELAKNAAEIGYARFLYAACAAPH